MLLTLYNYRRDEIMRHSDECRNKQGKIEADIKDLEVKINELDTRKSQIDSNYYNVTVCKRNLQKQIKLIDQLKASISGEFL